MFRCQTIQYSGVLQKCLLISTNKSLRRYKAQNMAFAIQLDETTDVSNCAQLLVLVCYATEDTIRSKSLLVNKLRTATREDVFELVNNFFKENGLQWSKIVSCTTEGAPAIFGRKYGFQARVKAVFPSVIFVHSFMHGFVLPTKLLSPNRKTSLNLVV